MVKRIAEWLALTKTEQRVLLFLSITLVAGIGIKWYKQSPAREQLYDYGREDSTFTARSAMLQDSCSSTVATQVKEKNEQKENEIKKILESVETLSLSEEEKKKITEALDISFEDVIANKKAEKSKKQKDVELDSANKKLEEAINTVKRLAGPLSHDEESSLESLKTYFNHQFPDLEAVRHMSAHSGEPIKKKHAAGGNGFLQDAGIHLNDSAELDLSRNFKGDVFFGSHKGRVVFLPINIETMEKLGRILEQFSFYSWRILVSAVKSGKVVTNSGVPIKAEAPSS